ncbi:MAG: hypothetical protein KM296_08100 [Brockia lithotrophica]|nr:hypothetical protein [Brockia lithotrophica]
MEGELVQCARCGKLFVRPPGSRVRLCPDCLREVEAEFRRVYDYLRKQRGRKASLREISEATGVSVRQIREFILEGRLRLLEFPELKEEVFPVPLDVENGRPTPSSPKGDEAHGEVERQKKHQPPEDGGRGYFVRRLE